MSYKIIFSSQFDKKFSKLDKSKQKILINWIEKNLENSADVRLNGKSLKGNLSDYWSYRVGSYRLMAKIQDKELILFMVDVGHRKEVYKTVKN